MEKDKTRNEGGGRHFEWEARVASLLLSFLSLFLLSLFWVTFPNSSFTVTVVPTFFPSQLLQKNLPNSCKHAFSHPYTWSLCEHTKYTLWRESFDVEAVVAVSCWECEMQTSLTSSRRIIFFKSVGIFFVKWQQSCCGFKFVSKV